MSVFITGTLAEIEARCGVRIQVLPDRLLVQLADGDVEQWRPVDIEPKGERLHFDGRWYALVTEASA